MDRLLVIIPTYNEKENIANILAAVKQQSDDIDLLVVDDNSPDGTAEIVQSLMKSDQSIHLIKRAGKQGLGTAYIAGFRYGLEQGYNYMMEMDADFSHNPKDVPKLLAAAQGGADIAIGSRYIDKGGVKDWDFFRHVLSKGASYYVQMFSGLPIMDPTAGFKCYRRSVLEAIDLNKIKFVGYAFQIEMKFAAWTLGYSLKEVPIIFEDRKEGTSKMNLSIVREAITGVLSMKRNFKNNKSYYAK